MRGLCPLIPHSLLQAKLANKTSSKKERYKLNKLLSRLVTINLLKKGVYHGDKSREARKGSVGLTKSEKLADMGKKVSEFDWVYDSTEECFLLEGKVVVKTENGKEVEFGKGDFVTFPKGLKCIWNIKEPVKKHYNFSD